MRRFLVVALVVGVFAAPAVAADCRTTDLVTGESSGNDQTVRTGLVGNYFWVQVGEYTGQDELEGTVSHEIPAGSVTATACPDGSVSFTQAAVVEELPAPIIEAPVELEILLPFEVEFSLLPS